MSQVAPRPLGAGLSGAQKQENQRYETAVVKSTDPPNGRGMDVTRSVGAGLSGARQGGDPRSVSSVVSAADLLGPRSGG